MQEKTRRWICRAAFLLVCVAPTCWMGGWAVWARHTRLAAEARRHWESLLLQELGLVARIERVTQDDDAEVILDGLEFADPETGQLVAIARRVHAATAGDRGWLIEISYPQITPGALPRLWAPIYDRLRHARGGIDWSALVVAHHVTLQSDGGDRSLSQLECQFGGSTSGATAQIQFLVDGLNMSERAKLTIARNRRESSPESTITLDTGTTPLPCSLLAHAYPALALLGSEARIEGRLQFRQDERGWQGDQFAARIENIDLFRLMEVFPHHLLTGTATLDLRQAAFSAGRLEAAEGSLQVAEGLMSRSLLQAAENWLLWNIDWRAGDGVTDRVAFRDLALEFHIDETGLTIAPKNDKMHLLIWGEPGRLVAAGNQPVSTTNLLRLLVPDSRHQVPATRQTAWLAAVLPVPGIDSERSSIPPSNPPIRLGAAPDARTDGQRR